MNRIVKPCECQPHSETDIPSHQPTPVGKEYYYFCTNPGSGQTLSTGTIDAVDDADAQTQLNNMNTASLYCRFDAIS